MCYISELQKNTYLTVRTNTDIIFDMFLLFGSSGGGRTHTNLLHDYSLFVLNIQQREMDLMML